MLLFYLSYFLINLPPSLSSFPYYAFTLGPFLPLPALSIYLSRLQLLLALASAEQEITMRNKAVDSDWSAVTMADLQTTSEGIH